MLAFRGMTQEVRNGRDVLFVVLLRRRRRILISTGLISSSRRQFSSVKPTTPDAGAAGEDSFRLALRNKPEDAALPVALRFTLTDGAGAVETTLDARN